VEALLFARGVSVTYEAIRKQRFTAIGGEADILICWSQLYRAFPVLTALTPALSAARMPPFSNSLAAMAVVPPLGRSREMRMEHPEIFQRCMVRPELSRCGDVALS
jgi:hypothetical protein